MKMGRTKKFFLNTLSTGINQLILMFSGFVIIRIILNNYGSEINGLVASINQFFVYFKLVEAGLAGAAIYALYKPLANNDYKAINGVVTAAKKFYNQAGYIFVLLTVGLALLYPILVDSSILTSYKLGLLVLILGVNGALEFFTLAKYRVLLTADQKMYVISLATIVYTLVNMLIIVVLATLKVDIVVLYFVTLISVFLRSFILMFYVKKKYKTINYSGEPDMAALNKRWDALYLQVLGAIQTGSPLIILTVVTGDLKLLSVYAIFQMIIIGLDGVLGIFKSGLFASFGDVIARKEEKTLQKAYREFELFYYVLITIVYSIAFVTIMPFIRIYTEGITDANYDLPLIGFLFVLNGLLYNIKNPQGMLVISAGLFRETRLQATIQGAIVIVVGFILTPFLGIMGILIASILSNIYRDIDLLFFVPKRVTKLPVRKSAYRIMRLFISVLVISTPFLFIELNPTGYLSWVFSAVIVGGYSLVVTAIMSLIFERKDTINIVRRVFKVVKK